LRGPSPRSAAPMRGEGLTRTADVTSKFDVRQSNFNVVTSKFDVRQSNFNVVTSKFDVRQSNFDGPRHSTNVRHSIFDVVTSKFDVTV
jgi:hypothetical protein